MTPERIAELKPHAATERRKFERGFNARMRKDAAAATFKYRPGNRDTRSPRKVVRDIKAAVEDDTPLLIFHEIEGAVFALVLCAGNCISVDAPLESQYLAAFQRIADFHSERLLDTPEELLRFNALVSADNAVRDAVDAYNLWRKGGGS